MLKSLLIKDYALIENIEIEFGKGLNIITGETGAGKSILIDAMSLLLGERASSDVIRKGADKSIVEGIFEISNNKKVKKILDENEIEANDDLIVRREITAKGTNRCFLNDTPVTLNVIKEIGDLLVDLHGQHDHQSLLKTEYHIEMLDEFANLNEYLEEYKNNLSILYQLQKELNELLEKEALLREKKDLYEFQIKEIDSVSPRIDEEEELENELQVLENSEKLLSLSNEIYGELYESENSIYDQLSKVKNKLLELSKIDRTFLEKLQEFESAVVILNEISEYLRNYRNRIDLDPAHLESIRERMGVLNLLKKKYGGTIKSVLEHREKIGKEVDLAENFTVRIQELQNEIDDLRKVCGDIAKNISHKRKEVSKIVEREVENVLKTLGISDPRFEVKINNEITELENYIIIDNKKYRYNERGIDFVEFYISTNAGEDTKPLVKVASGGEISRIMLALKSVLAKSDKLPILIFDEIDTGVSGRIAQKVGKALKSLAAYHQIIAITHLPQIASVSDYHYAVEKKKFGDRVVSSIKLLNEQERIREIAKLISGEKITEAALAGARELMSQKSN
ncbi:DNA repair protein RecN [Rosettibacter firmus]|uniref:DNA repair protein RecN n=1 Tax=Rosettibacter firmus TaxID=3111522 RepID=UPI00336C2910